MSATSPLVRRTVILLLMKFAGGRRRFHIVRYWEEMEGSEEETKRVVQISTGNDSSSAVVTVHGEDHTLGNAVRYMIVKNPRSSFCGYSIPHPSDDLINVRIHTVPGDDAVDLFSTALDDITAAALVIEKKFAAAVDEFEKNAKNAMDEAP